MSETVRVEAEITALAPGGDGVTHVPVHGERRAVFVPRAAIGDRARLEVDLARRPARAKILELLRPGPDRVEPACLWSSRCGGCDWMHLDPAAQARAHAELVRAALPAAWRGVPIASHAAPRTLGYRTRARVHVRCERGRVAVGMHESHTHDPVTVERCVVLAPAVEEARRAVGEWLSGSRGKGDVQIALGRGGAPVLEIRWDGDVDAACFGRLERAVDHGSLAGARLLIGASTRPAVIGDPTPWMTGADGEPLRLAVGGFGQASEEGNAALVQYVAELFGAWPAERTVELYAGAGNLSVLLARHAASLVSVESSHDACTAARANLAARGLATKVVEGDAETYEPSPATRVLVLDPPRTGARAAAERIAARKIARVLYVSCDPQTLGRDLGILEGTHAPVSVATFEMFPQTSHVETVVALERARGGARA